MYTIDCASPAKNHPKISCSEVSEIPRCQGGSASSPPGMPSERHTDASRNNSFRRFSAAEACQYVYYCLRSARAKSSENLLLRGVVNPAVLGRIRIIPAGHALRKAHRSVSEQFFSVLFRGAVRRRPHRHGAERSSPERAGKSAVRAHCGRGRKTLVKKEKKLYHIR